MGGLDVAYRALHPSLPINPGLIEYPLQLPIGVAQVMMLNTVSLLPGTVSANLTQNNLTVHVLDSESNLLPQLIAIEKRIARMFALPWKPINDNPNIA